MSLLMDALRKAEEAKKKAAQEAESEEVVAKSDAPPEADAPESETPPEIELSMEEIEGASPRSSVPKLDANIDFEDEEDYVLPSSVGRQNEYESDSNESAQAEPKTSQSYEVASEKVNEDTSEATQGSNASETVKPKLRAEDALNISEEEISEIDWDAVPPEAESASQSEIVPSDAGDPLVLDSLEEETLHSHEGGDAEIESPQWESGEPQPKDKRLDSTLEIKPEPELDEPRRQSARNVFDIKKSGRFSKRNIQIAAGGGVLLLLVLVGTYFYTSLNQGATFNIPAGSYVGTEFVDDGNSNVVEVTEQLTEADTLSDAEPLDQSETAQINIAALVPNDQEILGGIAVEIPAEQQTSVASAVTPETAPIQAQRAANLQPETLAGVPVETEILATTIGDEPTVATQETVVQNAETVASVDEPVTAPAATEPMNLISFRRKENSNSVDPNLDRAFAAYQRGSVEEAESLYRQTLAANPTQRDALLGLAAIVARRGDEAEALDLYSRLLARNPRDPIARAGLMELLPSGNPASQEADLRRLLNDHPNVAALVYAHGNFLASNERWSEAQQAYFRALQLAKTDAAISGLVNPDYAFNLAVSLEHLNQSESAQNYYREALEFARNYPAGFDLAAVRSRLETMAGSDGDD